MMWNYLLQATLCMAILYVPYHFWFRKETFFGFNRGYLLISLVISALVPFLPRWIQLDQPVAITMPAIELSAVTQFQAATVSSDQVHWTEMAATGYLIIAGLLLLRIIRDILAIYRMWRTGERRIAHGVSLVIHEKASAPFSFFNVVFVSHATLADDRLFEHVIQHELQHVRGKHSMDVLLLEVLCAVFWLSPLVYLYRRSIRAIHEYLADNIVTQEKRIDYAQLLIAQTYSGLRLALTNQFYQSQLKSRITMMMKEPSHRLRKWKYLLAIPLVAASILLFSFRDAAPSPVSGMAQAQLDTVPQEIFKVVEEMPRFPGCEDLELEGKARYDCAQKKLLEYIYSNLQYPEAASKNGVEGRVVGQFVIERDGSVSNIGIVRDIGAGCGDEVKRVLQSMNDNGLRWVPGRQRGKAVRVQFSIPVSFKMDKEEKPQMKKPASSTYDVKGETFKVVEQMPRFPGCEDLDGTDQDKFNCSLKKLGQYVGENLKYPEEARANEIEGTVIVRFVVEPNGTISSIQSVKSLGHGTDVEVIRLMESMNEMGSKWTPGRQGGKAVRVELTLPVQFRL
ncbi:MAG: M56 family metallopeptidase [Saprospiraceae bacterium]|nr:M56 family metallopeptidase [Saprospiraceae bacterium]